MNNEKIKPSYSEKRVQLGEVLPIDTPFTIMADISDVCNFRCNYCFRGMGKKEEFYGNNKLMDQDTFYRVVDQALEFDGRIKRFSLSHNGEPLAHPRFCEFVKYAKEKNVADSVEIHTNASLLTTELCQKIAESGLDRMIISLQGMSGKKYKEICGVELDFDSFVEKIGYLYSLKKNTKMYIKIVDAALDKGEEQIFYKKFSDIADRVFVETVVPLWDTEEKSNETKNKFGNDHQYQNYCPLMFYTINVLPDGTIFPCTNIVPPMILGNVHNISLKEIWLGEKRERFMRMQLQQTRSSHSVCRTCYIPQNTIMTDADIIDGHEKEILNRIEDRCGKTSR